MCHSGNFAQQPDAGLPTAHDYFKSTRITVLKLPRAAQRPALATIRTRAPTTRPPPTTLCHHTLEHSYLLSKRIRKAYKRGIYYYLQATSQYSLFYDAPHVAVPTDAVA